VVRVSVPSISHTYSIREAAALTGLPASTLRYYESIGAMAPIRRGASSKHRVYTEEDVDLLGLKIEFWQAIQAGDQVRAERLSNEARALADDLKKSRRP
jgi:hypothetical protein